MTMNPPVTGLRAPRISGGGVRRPLATAVGALLVLLALVVAPLTPATAATATADETFSFTMAPRGDGIVNPGQSLFVTLAATNRTSSSVRGGEVVLSLGRTPLTDRAAITAWLGDEHSDASLDALTDVTIEVIPPLGERTLDLVVDAEDFGSEDLLPGVYPLLATYTADTRTVTAPAVITVPGAATDPVGSLAIVMPITAPPTGEGLLTAEELASYTGEGGTLRDQVDAVRGTRAILAIDPAIPAAIRALGTTAPESAVLWLEDLLTLPNERFALQFGDADLASQVLAGLSRPLTVPTLAPYLDAADFTGLTEPTTTPSPTPTPELGAPMLPDTEALLDIGPAVGTLFWPATGTAGPDVVETLGAVVSDESPYVLVPSSTASTASEPHATSGEADLLVYDAEVSAALQRASTSTGEVARDGALAAATAYAELAPAGSAMLVTIDRGTGRTVSALRDALSAATGLPGREAIGFDELVAQPAVTTTIADAEPETARGAALESFQRGESELAAFATILDDPTLITGPERASILQLLGNGWRDAPEAWVSAVADHTAATATTLNAVGIEPKSDQTLLGSSTPMQFTIRNDLPWPVSLVLLAHPNDPRLVVQSTTPVDAGAQQNTRVEVPVEARVGSGESSIDLRLRSPTMVAIGDEVRVEVSVRAEWEGIGFVVMAVLVVGMLALGAIRTVTRMRSRRAGAGDLDAGDAGAGDVDAGGDRERDDV
ncbi:DUF6049 family protein [Microbacterium invictum]|uniref:2-oxoglutarate dehydrogenase n=1 Tax=Microbacterium invictum TaxID=515415 RepID=A0AA40SQV0_9MICO|nr:DUF6049 family protein [Microbacterium invictum]MBB4140621.1 hypothetical protein [Microbacterium invictum]